jgi:hydrogenase nickel incorporation protein HypA/HybF
MHEAGIVESILEIAISTTVEQNANSIRKIHVQVGKMNAVDPSALIFAFDILKENTKASCAELIIYEVPITVECSKCLTIFEVEDFNVICPKCSSTDTTIIKGNELNVVSLEVE